jgi:hypothetical protein
MIQCMAQHLTLRNMEEITSRITMAYDDPGTIPPTLRDSLFCIPLDQLVTCPLTVQQQWLAHYDCVCTFADTVMAPDEPLPHKHTLHLFFPGFQKSHRLILHRIDSDLFHHVYIVQMENQQCAAIFSLVY